MSFIYNNDSFGRNVLNCNKDNVTKQNITGPKKACFLTWVEI